MTSLTDDLFAQLDPPFGNHALGLAPAGDARAGKELGDAFAGAGV